MPNIKRDILLASALVCVMFFISPVLSGCSKEGPAEATQTVSGNAGEQPGLVQKNIVQPIIQNISDNPAFFSAQEIEPQSPAVKHLDSLIRPSLVKLFGGAKLIGEKGTETRVDGEVVLNTLFYAVRRYADEKDGIDLHDALRARNFSRSPRLGAKPTVTNKFIAMSFTKSTSEGSYSIALQINLLDQSIKVESYQLGSKYDRFG
jgi:hypothetical protein